MKPSVGGIVHYVSYGTPGGEYTSECRAAIVTEAVPVAMVPGADTGVSLCVLNPAGMFFNRNVPYHEGDTGHDHAGAEIPAKSYPGGTWHWPERVDDPPQVHVNADMSPQQVKQVTEMIQAAILQQAKRGRTTALKLPGRS